MRSGLSYPETYLSRLLEQRQRKNASYSLRSFARDCGISPALMSQILRKKRPCTEKTAFRIVDKLGLSPSEEKAFLRSVRISSDEIKKHSQATWQLDEDQFRAIADPLHYSILALSLIKDSKPDLKWIARKLGITQAKARICFERLAKMGMLTVVNGSFHQTTPDLETTRDIPSRAIRQHHRALLDRASHSLTRDSIEERYFGSMTLAFPVNRMDEAKDTIRRFRRGFAKKFETQSCDRVYSLNVNFIPMDKS